MIKKMDRLILIIFLFMAFFASGAQGQTYIDSCSPIIAPGEYVLNQSITNSIVNICINISSDDVILDGNGLTIDGIDAFGSYGVYVNNPAKPLTNVTITNLTVMDWDHGIYFQNVQNGNIINNIAISNNWNGIYLGLTSYTNLIGNNASNNSEGIELSSSNNNSLASNDLFKNPTGIGMSFSNNNTIDQNNLNWNENNSIIAVFSDRNTLSGNTILNSFTGIYLSDSRYNLLSDNMISDNLFRGMALLYGNNNNLVNNTVNSNDFYGIDLHSSFNNTLSRNDLNGNGNSSIILFASFNNILTGNNASNSGNGIFLLGSGNNELTNNNLSYNYGGVYLASSIENRIHNNYFNNTENFLIPDSVSTWNTTKTSGMNIIGNPYLGGNVWAHPDGTGFSQTCTDNDADGICDSSYPLDINNTDYLPLTSRSLTYVQSSTGKGPVSFSTSTGTIENLNAVNVNDNPEAPPAEANLIYGIFKFNITNLPPGGSVTLNLTFPDLLPPDTTYWKYGPNDTDPTPHWYMIPSIISGNKITLTLTDNGTGDSDLLLNGKIEDPGAPSTPGPEANYSEIHGMKFDDTNGNGIKDPGEPGLANWNINLLKPDGTPVTFTATDINGNYSFTSLPPGNYVIAEVPQGGWVQTLPVAPGTHMVAITTAGENVYGKDFGNFKLGYIFGKKFNDQNGNGIQDSGEPGLDGWIIKLTKPDGTIVTDVTHTNGSYAGIYYFPELTAGNYTVEEVPQPGWKQTTPKAGNYTLTITSGKGFGGLDFGNRRLPPTVSCVKGVNPSGKNIPPAKGGQDGFYQLLAIDSLDPAPKIFVKDTGSGAIFGPFTNGTNIKYTQSSTPDQKNIGGPNSAVAWHITGKGDAAIYAVNLANIKSQEMACLGPPPIR